MFDRCIRRNRLSDSIRNVSVTCRHQVQIEVDWLGVIEKSIINIKLPSSPLIGLKKHIPIPRESNRYELIGWQRCIQDVLVELVLSIRETIVPRNEWNIAHIEIVLSLVKLLERSLRVEVLRAHLIVEGFHFVVGTSVRLRHEPILALLVDDRSCHAESLPFAAAIGISRVTN